MKKVNEYDQPEKNLIIIIPLGIPGMGKTTFLPIIKELF